MIIPNIWQVIKFHGSKPPTSYIWFPVARVPLPHGRKISSPLGIRSTACSSNLALFRNGAHGSGLGRREVEKANSQSCDFGSATENRSVAVKLPRYSQRSQVSKKVERHLSITSTHVLPVIFAPETVEFQWVPAPLVNGSDGSTWALAPQRLQTRC